MHNLIYTNSTVDYFWYTTSTVILLFLIILSKYDPISHTDDQWSQFQPDDLV